MELTVLDILPEIQEYIFQYLHRCHLLNFACASKNAYDICKQILFRHLTVTSTSMVFIAASRGALEKLPFASSLSVNNNHSLVSQHITSKSSCSELPGNFLVIIENCSPDRLINLNIRKFTIREKCMKTIIQTLNNLQVLSLECVSMEDASWTALSNTDSLRKLLVHRCSISSHSVACIFRLRNIQHLELNDIAIHKDDNVGLVEICSLTQLRKLTVNRNLSSTWQFDQLTNSRDFSKFPSSSYLHLGNLVLLTELGIKHGRINNEALENLSINLAQLTTLSLEWCLYFTDDGLSSIHLLKCLKNLDVSNTYITDVGVSYISKVHLLKVLNLSQCPVSDVCLRDLQNLSSLQVLNLEHTGIQDDGMVFLKLLCSLVELNIQRTAVLGEGLSQLTTLNLHKLELGGYGFLSKDDIDEYCQVTNMQRDKLFNDVIIYGALVRGT